MAAVQQATVAPASNGSSHPYTCNTCQVAFRSSDLQRTHMQSDWHRYNLKRRVASLPPLTSEIFAEKVLANKASAVATAARAAFERGCRACTKTYYSENAYQNHLGSQKHKLQVLKMQAQQDLNGDGETESMMSSTFSLGEPLDTASTISAADTAEIPQITEAMYAVNVAEPITPAQETTTSVQKSTTTSDKATSGSDLLEVSMEQCLFCNTSSDHINQNVKHMSKQHGMFIPERDYLVDLEGLFTHLHEIIYDLHECLYCRQTKTTVSGVQTHMRDRGHCMIPYSTEDEMLDIGEFYDFRSTYSDSETDEDDEPVAGKSGGVSLGASRKIKVTVAKGDGNEEELDDVDGDGWESDASSLSSVPTDEITAMPIDDHSHRYKTLDRHRHHSHTDPRPHRNHDGYHSHAHATPHAVYHDEYELQLPSGRTAGHRSLNKYYRQNLHNRSSSADEIQRRAIEAADDSDDEIGDAQISNGRDRGRQVVARTNREMGMMGVSDAKKKEVKAVEKRLQKQEQRARRTYEWRNDKQNNFQKHFRDPLLQ